MNKESLKKIIHEVLNEIQDDELEDLHRGISSSTDIGRHWFKLINDLETVMADVKEFNTSSGEPQVYVKEALEKFSSIVNILQSLHPTIKGMDEIQMRDLF